MLLVLKHIKKNRNEAEVVLQAVFLNGKHLVHCLSYLFQYQIPEIVRAREIQTDTASDHGKFVV